MKNKIMSTVLAFVLITAFIPFASATNDEANAAADELHELGLLGGVGTNADGTINYDLDRTPTRAEAVTMLVRFLGKETEAKAGQWKTPFTDVAEWAEPYVGYAYANGLTGGVGGGLFGSASEISATQYLTFLLRALDYSSTTDFRWDKAWELTDKLGLTHGEYNIADTTFTRGDMVVVSRHALDCKIKDAAFTLGQHISGQKKNDTESEDYVISRLDFNFAVPKAGESIYNYNLTDCCATNHATAYWVLLTELPANTQILQRHIGEYHKIIEPYELEWETPSDPGTKFVSGHRYCCVLSIAMEDGYTLAPTCEYYWNGQYVGGNSGSSFATVASPNIVISVD